VTSAVAESIAQDKELSKILLHAAGVPVPSGRPVLDAEDAWAAACEIGGAVVVKPQDGNQGKGVAVNLTTREQVEAAYAQACEVSDEVLVERYLPGHDYRLLVVGDKLIAAARRDPPLVIGDGVHSIRQLVERVNSDPRRGEGHATSLTRIRLDEVALARLDPAGLTRRNRFRRGKRVILRNNANLSTGGTATDVTDDVHPEFAAQAVAAAQTIGLDIAGVDVVCDSVLRPLESRVAASSKSTRRRACACTCSPRSARAGRSARRSSPTCSPPVTMPAFRWSPSPAPTARRPPFA
jgi:cyanophycin synthetase